MELLASTYKSSIDSSKPIIQITNSQLYGITIQDNQKLNISFRDEFISEEYLTYGINHTGGSLLLKDLNISKKIISVKLDHEYYYGTNFSVIPRESLLVLFPAWVEHMVTPTTDDSKRYSISFGISRATYNMNEMVAHTPNVGDISMSDNLIKQQDNVTIEKV